MLVDYHSLLLAIGFAGTSLSLTLLATWVSARHERYLLTLALSMLVLVGAAVAFSIYSGSANPAISFIGFQLLILGFAVNHGAAHQYRTGDAPFRSAARVGIPAAVVMALSFASGYIGFATMVGNGLAGLLLLAVGAQYWRCRQETPVPVIALCLLYGATAISFWLCGLVLLAEGRFVIDAMPHNWAEDLNACASIIGVTGIGAISIALNQSRLARRHRAEALTDALTGLVNRRALFNTFGTALPAGAAVMIFDLDEFKAVNDKYGHAAGDEVLRRFTRAILANVPQEATAARMGGEEFAVVLPRSTQAAALRVAERIRKAFARDDIDIGATRLRCTVSAGVAFVGGAIDTFSAVLSRADEALYGAKRDGRNRVRAEGPRLVA